MNIGELIAILRVDDSELEPGINRGQERLRRMGPVAGAAGAAAGAALGVGLSSAMAGAIEMDTANARLEAQLGGANPMSQRAGEVAGALYSSAYGESMGEVNDAVRTVMQGISGMSEASGADLQRITGLTMSVASAFDQDLNGVVRATDQLMRTGLAPSAEAALNIITAGFQAGINDADDLLDTVSEYSVQFGSLGLSGAEAFGLMSQGVQAGARDLDTVGDALKEFNLLAVDTGSTAGEGFRMIGLDAGQMAADVAAGGDRAKGALDLTLDSLRAIEDPILRDQAAVALFGTKAEDLQDALFALDPSEAAAALGDVADRAAQVDAVIGATAAAKVTAMQRSYELFTNSLIATEGPLGTVAAGVSAFGPAGLSMVASLGMIGMAFGPILVTAVTWSASMLMTAATTAAGWALSLLGMAANAALAVGQVILSLTLWVLTTVAQGALAVASMALTAAGYVASWVLMGVQAMARAVMMAAAWLVAMGPVGWVIAAVVGLVALIIANWDQVSAWTAQAWGAVTGFISAAWAMIVGYVQGGVETAKGILNWFASLPGLIGSWFMGAATSANNAIGTLLGFVGSIPGRILGILGGIGALLGNAGGALVQGFLNGIVAAWNRVVAFVQQGVQWVRNLFPFSPAKTGPFSGSGYVTHSGKALTSDFAKSLRDGMPGIVSAAADVMDGAHLALTPERDARPSSLPGDGWLSGGPGMSVSRRGGDRSLTVIVHNPVAEKASDTLGRRARTMAALGPFAGDDDE